jgi:tetratricopeptide (TPR) repeat protein
MLLRLMLLLQGTTLPTMDDLRAQECAGLVAADPASAIINASEWQRAKGGHLADACLASAFAAQGKFAEASSQFKSAAQAAASAGDRLAASYWAQAGNAAIAASQPYDAILFLKEALNYPALSKAERANILIDRARAYVAANQPDSAKADLSEVRRIAPDNAAGWLLSATLARRMTALADAQNFIITAASLSPSDASVALEAGNIAVTAGAYTAAQQQWQQVIRIAPGSTQAKVAKGLLAQLDEQGLDKVRPGAPAVAQPVIAPPALAPSVER